LGHLSLVVTSAGEADTLFWRTFEPGETGSVRLLLGKGQDTVRLYGTSGEGPLLEIEQEPGADTVIVGEAIRRYRLYLPQWSAPRAKGDSTASQQAPRDWGASFGVSPRAAYDADLGLMVGGQAARTDYAFQRSPYGSRVRLVAEYATAADGLRTELIADVRRVNPRLRLELRARASEIEMVHFAGYGNETPTPDGSGFHDVDQWQFLLAPTVVYASSARLRLYGGPIVKYSTTDLHGDHLIAQTRPLGTAGFGRVGLQTGAAAATSDTSAFDDATGELVLNGSLYPPIWSGESTFGTFAIEAKGRVPIRLGPTPVIAGRLGVQRVWGAFPYDEAAFLGGQRSLRGYGYQRFAGDAMLYGSAEMRVPIARVLEHWVPTGIGVFALADVGRVWAEGEESSKLHTAGGGGVWLSFFEERNTVSLAIASGAEGNRWYLRTGMTF
jgi:Omp85 superfamily domain